MGRVTKVTPTKVTKEIKVITEATKAKEIKVTKVTRITKVTKETKVITEATKAKEIKVTKVTRMTKVTKVTKEILTAATKTKVLVTRVLVGVTKGKIPVGENTIHPRGDPTRLPIQRDKTKVQMILMLILPDVTSFISHVDTLPTLIQDEYLHDPSTLPSNHLNVTVSVQDKDKESRTSVRCIVGKAVLDTANYSYFFSNDSKTKCYASLL